MTKYLHKIEHWVYDVLRKRILLRQKSTIDYIKYNKLEGVNIKKYNEEFKDDITILGKFDKDYKYFVYTDQI